MRKKKCHAQHTRRYDKVCSAHHVFSFCCCALCALCTNFYMFSFPGSRVTRSSTTTTTLFATRGTSSESNRSIGQPVDRFDWLLSVYSTTRLPPLTRKEPNCRPDMARRNDERKDLLAHQPIAVPEASRGTHKTVYRPLQLGAHNAMMVLLLYDTYTARRHRLLLARPRGHSTSLMVSATPGTIFYSR